MPDAAEKADQHGQEPAVLREELRDERDASLSNDELDAIPAWKARGELRGWRLYSVQVCLALCLMLSVLDSTIVATALVAIGREFNDFVRLQWIVLAYLLTNLGFSLIFTRISDVIGRKWTTITALVIVLAFSLGAALSQSLEELIAFRALQGIGASGLYTMTFTAFPEITPPEKIAAMGVIPGVVFAVAAVLGPTLGGVITTQSTWRWIFYLNAPYCGVVIIAILLVWPKTTSPGKIEWRQLDLVGCVLFMASSVLLVFALQEAGSGSFAWDSGATIACLVIAGVSAVCLGFWICYASKSSNAIEPLIPRSIITHKIMLANFIVMTLVGYVFYTVLIMLPIRLQLVNLKSAQKAGIDILPLSGAAAAGSMLAGFTCARLNLSYQTLIAGCFFMVIGAGLLSSIDDTNQHIPARLYGYEAILGFGIGIILAASSIIVKLYSSLEQAAAAQGLISNTRVLGGNIGLAIATIIQNARLSSELQGVLTPEQIKQLRKSLNTVIGFNLEQLQAVGRVFPQAFQTQLQVCIGIAGLGFLVSFLTFDRNPPKLEDVTADEVAEKHQSQPPPRVARPNNNKDNESQEATGRRLV